MAWQDVEKNLRKVLSPQEMQVLLSMVDSGEVDILWKIAHNYVQDWAEEAVRFDFTKEDAQKGQMHVVRNQGRREGLTTFFDGLRFLKKSRKDALDKRKATPDTTLEGKSPQMIV